MIIESIRQFGKFTDIYYWRTAVLIAKNGLARQYRNSFLGVLWTLLQPLLMAVVYSLVMPMIMRGNTMEHYPLYIFVSLPLWSFFSTSLINSSHSILLNGETLKRCMISSTVFPVADVMRTIYTFFVSFTVMYIMAIVYEGPSLLSPLVLLVPLYMIPVIITMWSGAIAIAFFAPYVRDIGEAVIVAMTVLFWLTPVVYPLSRVGERAHFWMQFNPFAIMMRPIQMLAYERVMPGIAEMGSLFAVTAIAVAVGFVIFRACRRNYVYYL